MPDTKNNLYLYEALALRDAYDRRIEIYESLLDDSSSRNRFLSIGEDNAVKQPAEGFNEKEMLESFKKTKVKRLKLNNEIQAANFTAKFGFEGEQISIAEALELRKSISNEIEKLSARVSASAFNTVIHKEERDIVGKPRYSFSESYAEYISVSERLRMITVALRAANYNFTVSFKDE